MSEKTRKMILIKDGIDLDIFDDKNMSDRVLMLDYPKERLWSSYINFTS